MNRSSDSPPSQVKELVLSPGDHRYTLAIPAAYTGDQPTPLILALHFGGHGEPFYGGFILTGLVEPALRPLEAIIVAPDCTADDWTQPVSETDVLKLLDHILGEYNLDPRRTLVTGYSMGGVGAWHLAMRHQERFRTALIMAGIPPLGVVGVDWKIPLYVIHSRQDELMPLEPTESAVSQLKAKGISVELVLLDGVTHFETHRFVTPLRDAVPWIKNAWG